MGFCRRFLEEIRQINFTEGTGAAIHRLVLASTYQALGEQRPRLVERIAQLPENIPADTAAGGQLAVYRQKLASDLERLDRELEAIRISAIEAGLVLDGELSFDDNFIHDFSSYFRDLKHLAETLSDAPLLIKAHQTSIYASMLSRLSLPEQEHQLQILSTHQISDLLKHAIHTFDEVKDPTLRHQCQQIVQMACFELVLRQVNRLKAVEPPQVDHQQYQTMLRALSQQIPDVHQSEILDSLSKYQNTEGLTIGALLYQAEQQLNISDSDAWGSELARSSALQTRKLCHLFRFGQDDRREYVSKRQDFMARDLFWARNIRDIELFTKSSFADDTFQSLALKRYFATDNPYQKTKTKLEGIEGQVERAFHAVKMARKVLPSGDKGHKLSDADRREYIKLIKQHLREVAHHPVVERNEQGQLSIEFVQFDLDDDYASQLLNIIIDNGGFGLNADTMVMRMQKQSALAGHFQYRKVTGDSLAEIRRKLVEEDVSWKPAPAFYDPILKDIEKAAGGDISSLGLNSGQELLLRKVLELYYFYHQKQPAPAALVPVFARLAKGEYRQVLTSAELPRLVDESYQVIAGLTLNDLPETLRPVVEKARKIEGSAKERQEKLIDLQQGLTALDAEKIKTVFLEEYRAMAPTLGLTEADDYRLAKDIGSMAEELVRLIDRTNHGEPVFTKDEEVAYFSALDEIAKALSSSRLNDVQFKIPHSVRGLLSVEAVFADGHHQTLKINLPHALPYSLIKPPGDAECVFSYGGSRGIIAPFAGLDEAYAGKGKEKRRLFTHSRLLGVGQYGVVKEVEGLVTSLNQVIKKGFVVGDEPTFTEASRSDLRTRPISARNDPLYRQESTILQALSKASDKSKATLMNGTQFWLIDDKKREKGRLFTHDSTPRQYQILTERAQGDTFADLANRRLNQFSKGDVAYHNPCFNGESGPIKEMLALSEALVEEALRFQALGFSHNDIKPENFLTFRRTDGRYAVRYIDWATGGFSQRYDGQNTQLAAIFAEVFGKDLTIETDGQNKVHDNGGRFVEVKDNGDIIYGIRPRLEILHGARNATLPYISPQVLGEDRAKSTVAAGVLDRSLDTHLEACDPLMDDWALTAMIFGVCNRQAYFALAKGRAVGDYVIPGIIDADGQDPLGLKIVDVKKFNTYFVPETCDEVTEEALASGSAYQQQDAVMFIPSNQREGEPLHLYRRLLAVKASLEKTEDDNLLKLSLKRDIEQVLAEVHSAIASGKGLSRQKLKSVLNLAETCIKNYEKLNDAIYLLADRKRAVLEAIVGKYQDKDKFTANDLLKHTDEDRSELWVLCTYPKTDETLAFVIQLFDKAFDEQSFQDLCLKKEAPYRELLTAALASKNPDIVSCLLAHVEHQHPDFISLVREQGLLHHALQEGYTNVATALVSALKRAGASEEEIFNLLLEEYGTAQNQINGQPQIKWAINALKIAIQNGSEEQLALILKLLPQGQKYDDAINEALHSSAVYSQVSLFKLIEAQYNSINPDHPLTTERLLNTVFAPDDSSPYHLFLRDEKTLTAINWDALKESPNLGARFLLNDASEHAHTYPLMVALANNNLEGLEALLRLGDDVGLSKADWQSFYKQTDIFGKNSLNYLLEQGHFDVLPWYLQTIRDRAGEGAQEVMLFLMSNIHPVNPLKNFLATDKPTQDKLKVLGLLLNALCSNFRQAPDEAQRARVTALLVNKEWLIEQAQDPNAHEALRQLVQNDALSNAFKHILFKTLSEDASTSPIALSFYKTLLKEIKPHLNDRDATYIGLQQPIIIKAVSLVRDDMSALMTTLTREIDTLKQSLSRLELSILEMTSRLHEKEQSALAQENLRQQAELRIADVNGEVARLRQEMELAHRRFSQTEMGLQQQVARAQAESAMSVEKFQGEIQLLRSHHQGELRDLHDASIALEGQRALVMQEYTNAQELLQKNRQEITQLQGALRDSVEHSRVLGLKEETLSERIASLEDAQRVALGEKALLSKNLEKHIAELAEARTHLEQLRQENQGAQSMLASVTAETIALRSSLDVAIREKEARVALLEQQLVQARDENSSRVGQLTEELAQAQRINFALITQLREQLLHVESERDGLSENLSKTRAQVLAIEHTVTHLREELSAEAAQHRELLLKLHQVEEAKATDLLGLRTRLEAQSKDAQDARLSAQNLVEELAHAREDNQRQQESALSLSAINHQLQDQLYAAGESIQALRAESSARLDIALQENAIVSAALAARVEELTQIKTRIDQLSRENQATQAKLSSVTEETTVLRISIEEKEARVSSLEQQLVEAQRNKSSEVRQLAAALAEALRTSTDNIAQLTERLRQGETERTRLAQILADNQVAFEGAQQQLTELRPALATLSSQNGSLRTQLEQFEVEKRTELFDLRSQLEERSREAIEAMSSVQRLEHELSQAREDNQRQQASTQSLSVINHDLEERLHAAVALSADSSHRLELARQENTAISATLAARVEELTQIQRRIEELSRESQLTQARLVSVTEEAAALRISIGEKDGRVSELEQVQRVNSVSIAQLRSRLVESDTERARLDRSLAENQAALAESRQQLTELRPALENLSAQNNALRLQLEQFRLQGTELVSLRSQLDEQSRGAQEATLLAQNLQQQLTEARDHNQRQQESMASLAATNRELEEQLREAVAHSVDSTERLEAARHDNALMATTLATRIDELTQAQTSIERLSRENQNTQARLFAAIEETAALRTSIGAKEERVSSLEQQLAEARRDKLSEVAQLTTVLLEAQKGIAQLTEQLSQSEIERLRLAQNLADKNLAFERAERQLAELSAELSTLLSQNSELGLRLTQIQEQNVAVVSGLHTQLEEQSRSARDAILSAQRLEQNLTHAREENLRQQESAAVLSAKNLELEARLQSSDQQLRSLMVDSDQLKQALAALRASREEDLGRFQHERAADVIRELAGRINKARRFIDEKAAGMGPDELDARYDKHLRLIEKIKERWLQNPLGQFQHEYDELVAAWEQLSTDWRRIRNEKAAALSPQPIHRQAERPAAPPPRAEEQAPPPRPNPEDGRPQEVPEPEVRPAAPPAPAPAPAPAPVHREEAPRRPVIIPERIIPRVAQEESRLDPLNQSWIKIYSLLPRESDEERYSRQRLFTTSDQGVLITINFPEQQLTIDEAKKFTSRTGLNVKSPSGQSYSLNYSEKTPQALLTQQSAQKMGDESDEQYQQRLATTIINMIDNVLSKGVTASVYTENPFIAKIAELYLNHLKTNVGIHIAFAEVKGCPLSGGDEKLAQAGAVFTKLLGQLSKERIETAPWYKDALKFREEPPEHHPSLDGGFVPDR